MTIVQQSKQHAILQNFALFLIFESISDLLGKGSGAQKTQGPGLKNI